MQAAKLSCDGVVHPVAVAVVRHRHSSVSDQVIFEVSSAQIRTPNLLVQSPAICKTELCPTERAVAEERNR